MKCLHKKRDIGTAFVNTYVNGRGIPASLCAKGVTISQSGPAVLISVVKCIECGHSISLNNFMNNI